MSVSKRLLLDQMEINDLEDAAYEGYRGVTAIVLEFPITIEQLERLGGCGWRLISEEKLRTGDMRYQFRRTDNPLT